MTRPRRRVSIVDRYASARDRRREAWIYALAAVCAALVGVWLVYGRGGSSSYDPRDERILDELQRIEHGRFGG